MRLKQRHSAMDKSDYALSFAYQTVITQEKHRVRDLKSSMYPPSPLSANLKCSTDEARSGDQALTLEGKPARDRRDVTPGHSTFL